MLLGISLNVNTQTIKNNQYSSIETPLCAPFPNPLIADGGARLIGSNYPT